MESFEFILFNTGYIGRLVENTVNINKLQKILKRNKAELVLTKDEITGLKSFTSENIVNQITEDLKSKNISINGVIIRSNSLLTVFRIHRQLVELDYCADLNNILGARLILKKYLIIEYDTESY